MYPPAEGTREVPITTNVANAFVVCLPAGADLAMRWRVTRMAVTASILEPRYGLLCLPAAALMNHFNDMT